MKKNRGFIVLELVPSSGPGRPTFTEQLAAGTPQGAEVHLVAAVPTPAGGAIVFLREYDALAAPGRGRQ